VVAKVEWRFDELFPRVASIVTNMAGWSKKVVECYNGFVHCGLGADPVLRSATPLVQRG
jgi:hypothetical protein